MRLLHLVEAFQFDELLHFFCVFPLSCFSNSFHLCLLVSNFVHDGASLAQTWEQRSAVNLLFFCAILSHSSRSLYVSCIICEHIENRRAKKSATKQPRILFWLLLQYSYRRLLFCDETKKKKSNNNNKQCCSHVMWEICEDRWACIE